MVDKSLENNKNFEFFPNFDSSGTTGNILGSKKPKLIINEYTDFECPYCGISNLVMHKLAQEFKEVQIIHKNEEVFQKSSFQLWNILLQKTLPLNCPSALCRKKQHLYAFSPLPHTLNYFWHLNFFSI